MVHIYGIRAASRSTKVLQLWETLKHLKRTGRVPHAVVQYVSL